MFLWTRECVRAPTFNSAFLLIYATPNPIQFHIPTPTTNTPCKRSHACMHAQRAPTCTPFSAHHLAHTAEDRRAQPAPSPTPLPAHIPAIARARPLVRTRSLRHAATHTTARSLCTAPLPSPLRCSLSPCFRPLPNPALHQTAPRPQQDYPGQPVGPV